MTNLALTELINCQEYPGSQRQETVQTGIKAKRDSYSVTYSDTNTGYYL